MKTRTILLAIILAGVAAPASALDFRLGVGHARVTSDAFAVDSQVAPGVDRVPSFRRDLTVVSLDARFRAYAVVPLSVGVFSSDSERFTHAYAFDPQAPTFLTPVNHSLAVRGARLGLAPQLPLGNGWELDGTLGVQYREVRIGTGQLGVGNERQNDLSPYAGAGITWWPVRVVGIRAGVAVANDYQAVNLGVRVGF